MGVSKFVYNGQTKIDLTADTVAADKLLSGATAHNAAGNQVTGTLVVQKYYTGSSAPSSSLGNNGDLYFQK